MGRGHHRSLGLAGLGECVSPLPSWPARSVSEHMFPSLSIPQPHSELEESRKTRAVDAWLLFGLRCTGEFVVSNAWWTSGEKEYLSL